VRPRGGGCREGRASRPLGRLRRAADNVNHDDRHDHDDNEFEHDNHEHLNHDNDDKYDDDDDDDNCAAELRTRLPGRVHSATPPPDLDCGDIPYRNFRVIYTVPDPDPHRFDGDHDGIGCET
jgi:hypothetical protein